MTMTEYVELAQRTASTKTKADKIGHGCLGLIGEAGEIIDIIKKRKYMGMTEEMAREKLIDEISDCCWYIAEWCTGTGNNMQVIFDESVGLFDEFSVEKLAVALAGDAYELWGLSQDGIMYHYQYDAICAVAKCIKALCYKIGVELETVLKHNIDKLKARYPDGFSAERSNRRYEHA